MARLEAESIRKRLNTRGYVRKDVRIAFDWGDALSVGGSTAEPYRSFPRDNFSVRWTGQVLPRFSEAGAVGVALQLRGAEIGLERFEFRALRGQPGGRLVGVSEQLPTIPFGAHSPRKYRLRCRGSRCQHRVL